MSATEGLTSRYEGPPISLGIRDPAEARTVTICGEGSRPLLTIYGDGTVEGEVEDAGEAGRVFVEYIRRVMRCPRCGGE